MTLLEIVVYVYSNLCIKLKWFSTYLLNTSLKGLDHFILMNSYTNDIIGDPIRLFEFVY